QADKDVPEVKNFNQNIQKTDSIILNLLQHSDSVFSFSTHKNTAHDQTYESPFIGEIHTSRTICLKTFI
ncbi:MAG: hypothetical protein II575_06305, partial [Bacteroidales bacterium]|nr:hypothetical protein [Bacteroidales bacterium]